MSGRDDKTGNDDDTGVIVRSKTQTKKPAMYKVLMLNDDYTPMNFVISIMQQYFGMDHAKAITMMLEVHHSSQVICGIYTHDIAETKIRQISHYARQHDHPLLCVIKPM